MIINFFRLKVTPVKFLGHLLGIYIERATRDVDPSMYIRNNMFPMVLWTAFHLPMNSRITKGNAKHIQKIRDETCSDDP
jgi:hypothetical protein